MKKMAHAKTQCQEFKRVNDRHRKSTVLHLNNSHKSNSYIQKTITLSTI